jgi:hypothetical protein
MFARIAFLTLSAKSARIFLIFASIMLLHLKTKPPCRGPLLLGTFISLEYKKICVIAPIGNSIFPNYRLEKCLITPLGNSAPRQGGGVGY